MSAKGLELLYECACCNRRGFTAQGLQAHYCPMKRLRARSRKDARLTPDELAMSMTHPINSPRAAGTAPARGTEGRARP